MKLQLTRTSDDGIRTLGVLTVANATFFTVERCWIPNPAGLGGMRRQSCVPVGLYTLIPHQSNNFPNTYALVNPELGVWYQPGDIPSDQSWGRTAILIHGGNSVKDVVGCIAPGKERWDSIGVLRSGVAMRELNRILGKERHTLEIA